jgi:hypothetical protein
MPSKILPSKILALICLSIVRRYRPAWLAVSVVEAAREENVNHERISRLATAAQQGFERVLAPLLRRGRPPKDREADQQAQRLAITQALLSVATPLLRHISWRKPAVRALVLGAYLRLKQEQPQLTQKAFCEAIALSPRSLRHWLANPKLDAEVASSPVKPTPPVKPPRKRPPRRPRFGFEVVLPDTQLAGDTTDITAFDCDLKLIATQDVGGRDDKLLESVVIDDHESAELVIEAFTEAIDGREGLQAIVDQGTPYMAQATREALEALGAEHAPQVEGTPTDKATMERALGTAKSIAEPLLALTNRLAQKVPALRNTKLAIALSTLLVAALLKSYQAGARAQRRAESARQGLRREDLLEVAKEHRECSRAEDRSTVLLLRFIHDAYDIKRPVQRFVHSLRRFPIEVLRRAELAFGKQVHRDDIRDRASYFAAIVRRLHKEHLTEQARRKADREQQRRLQANADERADRKAARHDSPATWLRQALEALANQWQPEAQLLLFGGAGLGRHWLAGSIALLVERHGGPAARDIADGVFRDFAIAHADRLGDDGRAAVRALLDAHLPPGPENEDQSRCTQDFAAAIIPRTGPEQRSPPEGALSNLAAKPGGS